MSQNKKAQMGRSLLMVSLLFLGLAGLLGWTGYGQYLYAQMSEALEHSRDQVVEGVQQAVVSQINQFSQRLENPTVQAALASGNRTAAISAVAQGLSAQDVQLFDSRLEEAYADIEGFGVARLGLLELALRGGSAVVAHVVRDGGQPSLGLAAPVSLQGEPAVIYVRQSLSPLLSILDNAHLPSDTFMGLRQGNFDIARKGNTSLGHTAETLARPVANTHLRVVAEVPDIGGALFGMSWMASLGIAGTLGVIGLGVLFTGLTMVSGNRRKKVKVEKSPRYEVKEDKPKRSLKFWGKKKKDDDEDEEEEDEEEHALIAEAKAALAAAPKPPPPPPRVVEPELITTPPPPIESTPSRVKIPASIFRAYDIRGVVGKELTPDLAQKIGQAIGNVMQEQSQHGIVVGRDGRLSSEELSDALIAGLRVAGCEVTDIGLAPTPLVYFAREHLNMSSCVAVTGSHNPADYNGFKIVIGGQTLFDEGITDLYTRISSPNALYKGHSMGPLNQAQIMDDYVQRIAGDVQMERSLKVVIDAGNGVAGAIAPQLLEAIGAEVIPLHCEVDGNFPNHHPDPSEPANLEDLKQIISHMGADIGIAFDGDGDRLGVVTREGTIIHPDRLLMLFAADVLMRNPGALVIFDVKCSSKLHGHILLNGGSPMMWKTGHSFIKNKMQETGAELAGEMSGHFFFQERWYGFDDGLYAAARLLEVLTQDDRSPSEVLGELPNNPSTPEIKVKVKEGEQHKLVEQFVEGTKSERSPFAAARLSTIDGLRADFPDGWGLVRASNTTPVLVLRFEGDNQAALARIQRMFGEKLAQLGVDAGF